MELYGGLISSLLLIVFSPVFSGTPTSLLGEGVDFAWFPLKNPGIISIPLGFLLGWIGSVTSREKESPALAAEMEVRQLTGFGAEKPVAH